MARVLYAAKARTDLKSVYGHTVDEWGAAQATRYLNELRRKCELLAEHPKMAPAVVADSPLRVALCQKHRILYQPITDGIEVLRIVHQARDFATILYRIEAVREILQNHQLVRDTE